MDKKYKFFVLLFFLLQIGNSQLQETNVTCEGNLQCVPISECQTANDITFPCNEEESEPSVCCNIEQIVFSRSAFPDDCGGPFIGDRITGGDLASLGEFPWMALLGYKLRELDFIQFLCGGSIITQNFVLTAAHCISIDPSLSLHVVRLGEYDTQTEKDCVGKGKLEVCGAPHVDVLVAKTIPHINYNNVTLEHDIALVKMKNKVTFSEYISPVCLPFNNVLEYSKLVNNKAIISGWGKISSGTFITTLDSSFTTEIAGSNKLRYANVQIWDSNRCNSSVPKTIRPIKSSQICANGVKNQDSCKGDSGGPMVNFTSIIGDKRNYQIGIVSFSSSQICGNNEFPTIYTKVDYYLDWIVENVK